MSKERLLAVFILLSFSFSGVTFSAVDSIKVSGDINLETIVRDYSAGREAIVDNDHEFLISQIRLRFDADLIDDVSAVLRFLSQETWGEDNADDLEVDLGYLELKKFLFEPLTLIVGRQNLRYGNAFIIGDPDTDQGAPNDPGIGLPQIATDLSLKKSFDAARLIVDLSPWTIDFIYALLDETDAAAATTASGSGTGTRHDDEVLWGVNVNYDWGPLVGASEFGESEVYFFHADNTPQSATTSIDDDLSVVGSRTQLNFSENLTLGIEGAFQFGRFWNNLGDQNRIRAWAGQFISEYRFLDAHHTKLHLSYTYTSGDEDETGEKYEAWNVMFEDQRPADIMGGFLDQSNRQFIRVVGSTMPREDFTIELIYVYGWLTERFTTVAIQPGMGPVAGETYFINNNATQLGQEFNINLFYDYTEDIQIKATGAWIFPGEVFIEPNEDMAYSYRVGMHLSF